MHKTVGVHFFGAFSIGFASVLGRYPACGTITGREVVRGTGSALKLGRSSSRDSDPAPSLTGLSVIAQEQPGQ